MEESEKDEWGGGGGGGGYRVRDHMGNRCEMKGGDKAWASAT